MIVPASPSTPHVVVAGGGPAGLLSAILLSQAGVSVTVLEKSPVTDPWSTKSFSINLNPRGLGALGRAGVLEQVQAAGMARRQVILESSDGQQQCIPKNPPNYALTRPALVECLEEIVRSKHADTISVQRGVEVKHVATATTTTTTTRISADDDEDIDYKADTEKDLIITLDNGSSISCTHIVGADGKWSVVRESVEDFKDKFQVQAEPAFGICMSPSVSPPRWQLDATTVFRPKSPKFYVLAAPLPDGRFSVSVVCFDEIKEDYPWLVPREDQQQQHQEQHLDDWEAEYGRDRTSSSLDDQALLSAKIAKMLKEELPLFYEDIRGMESLSTARVNRRTSWLKPLTDNPRYSDESGRVALIGDAAHATTPAMGEGCNCALQSAVCLVDSLGPGKPTVDSLTKAFIDYGIKRPAQVLPIQLKSASNNQYKIPEPQPP